MIRTLVLWPGPPPAGAAAACREYSRRMIAHGITWYREGTIPTRSPAMLSFLREAALLLAPAAGNTAPAWHDAHGSVTLWGEVAALELEGPQPVALAALARLAEDHGLVLFDLLSHRLLRVQDISTAFGASMIPLPAAPPPRELIGRCMQRDDCGEEMQVLGSGGFLCFRPLDPFAVVPVPDERERFELLLDEFGLGDLEQLRDRLDELIEAESISEGW